MQFRFDRSGTCWQWFSGIVFVALELRGIPFEKAIWILQAISVPSDDFFGSNVEWHAAVPEF